MVKTKIIPCRDDCPECNNDIARYEKVLNELSSMHLGLSNDPAILYDASYLEFKGEYWPSVPGSQRDLIMIAIKYELSWTQ